MNKAVIFDLDGTLINSIGGIACAVNLTRKFYNLPPQDENLIASFIGNGVRKLIERSLAQDNSAILLDDAVKTMTEIYNDNPAADTFLYPEVAETLAELVKDGWHLAVVTNKPQLPSEKILQTLGIREFFDENIGGGGEFPLKPAPDALLYIMEKYQIDPEKCFVVGDNYTDLDFAANGGVKSIFCTWGFGKTGKVPATFTADNFASIVNLISGK